MVEMTIKLDEASAERLDKFASTREIGVDSLVREAIAEYVEREEWLIAEIEAGIAEVERGEFASDADIARILAKYAP